MARPLAFNKEEKLQQAMLLFWQNGYDGTSVQDLVNTLKINKFSLYNTFGDKQTIYHEALAHYSKLIVSRLIAPLTNTEHPPLERIFNYFHNLAEKLSDPAGISGCFMQNAGLETAHKDPEVAGMLVDTLRETEKALKRCLDEALASGELEKNHLPTISTETLAQFLVIQAQGLIVYRKAADAKTLRNQISLLVNQIGMWQA